MDGKKDMLFGIDSLEQQIVKRTMGAFPSREYLGAGIMHKKGISEDIFDRSYEPFALIYVVRGRGSYTDESGTTYPLGPGTVFQRFPGRAHSTRLEPDSNWAEYFIDMGPALGRALMASRLIREDRPVLSLKADPLLEKPFLDYFLKLQQCPEEDLNRMIPEVLNLMNHVYSLATQNQDSRDEKMMVDRARNYFFNHCEERINLEEFCRKNGWGYERFRKVFKKNTALSPGQFIIQRRIDRACEWLLATDKSIKEIGSRLGYPSPYEFSHQFKKVTGRSPREYRRLSC
ncbi:MAG: AraC family transcriptional regulator [Spirochaetales bacterium]|nr:AraC family transcriptional regulator [Spirochaetales bacterium]